MSWSCKRCRRAVVSAGGKCWKANHGGPAAATGRCERTNLWECEELRNELWPPTHEQQKRGDTLNLHSPRAREPAANSSESKRESPSANASGAKNWRIRVEVSTTAIRRRRRQMERMVQGVSQLVWTMLWRSIGRHLRSNCCLWSAAPAVRSNCPNLSHQATKTKFLKNKIIGGVPGRSARASSTTDVLVSVGGECGYAGHVSLETSLESRLVEACGQVLREGNVLKQSQGVF